MLASIQALPTVGLTTVLLALALLLVKHFVADFLIQTDWMVRNKGTFGHPGGLLHAFVHAALTFGIITTFTINYWILSLVFFIEFVAHYFIDLFKMQINRRCGLAPNSELFWILIGFDQLLHGLTYVAVLFLTFSQFMVLK